MPIRSILVPILPGDPFERRLDAALPLARKLEAHFDIVALCADPIETLAFSASGFMPNGATLQILQDETDRYGRATETSIAAWRQRNALPDRLRDRSLRTVCATFAQHVGAPDREMARRGRLADLIVLDRPHTTEGWWSTVVDAAIFDTGRPVLLIPPAPFQPVPTLGRVAVAWNGSLQATRAIVGAMPLLHEADEVVVITDAKAPADSGDAGALCHALAFHGVRAGRIMFEPEPGEPVGAGLLRAVHRQEATLLVMGAFTHSRLRQFLLGGATRHLLENADLPIVVAH